MQLKMEYTIILLWKEHSFEFLSNIFWIISIYYVMIISYLLYLINQSSFYKNYALFLLTNFIDTQ